jgi:hypothetical protein
MAVKQLVTSLLLRCCERASGPERYPYLLLPERGSEDDYPLREPTGSLSERV